MNDSRPVRFAALLFSTWVLITLALIGPDVLGTTLHAAETETTETSSTQKTLGTDGARHLLSRVGFGASPAQIERYARLEPEAAVDRLLAGTRTTPLTAPPEWVHRPPSEFMGDTMDGREAAQERRRMARRMGEELKGWWYEELLATDSPITEHMVLFWHNHFTSSQRKVKLPQLMYGQNQLFRQHALGNFRTLLHAIVYDPAMVLYLDTQSNNKGKPNENFARELMELFTLGEGHYTEQDIKEAARAFTGIKINRHRGETRFAKRRHDFGEKEFFGKKGNFEPRDIVNILLEQERVSIHLTEKLWRDLVSPDPDPVEVRRLAKVLRDHGYEMKPWLRALLVSPHFWDPAHRGTLIKSPVDLIVGTARTFGMPVRETQRLVRLGRGLGQDLLEPPNVKGWPGGAHWISSATLVLREQYLTRVFEGIELDRKEENGGGNRMVALRYWRDAYLGRWFTDLGENPGERTRNATRMLLPVTPVNAPDASDDVPEIVLQLVLDPTYQLK